MGKYFKKIIVIIDIIVIVSLIVYYLIYKNNGKNDNYIDNVNTEEKITYEDSIEYKGMIYKRVDGCFYSIDTDDGNDSLHIFNNKLGFGATINIIDMNEYSQVKFDDYKSIETYFKNKTSNVKYIDTQVVDNKNVLKFDYSKDGNNGILAYTYGYDNYYYEILMFSNNKNVNDIALDIITKILYAGIKAQ